MFHCTFASKGNLEETTENVGKQTESIVLCSGETKRQEGTCACYRAHISRQNPFGLLTKCKTPLTLWDSRKQRLVGKSAMAVSVNQKLDECTALIHARFYEFNEREETFTATDVRDAYQGQIHRQALILESFSEYLAQTKERIGIDRALETFKLRTYRSPCPVSMCRRSTR